MPVRRARGSNGPMRPWGCCRLYPARSETLELAVWAAPQRSIHAAGMEMAPGLDPSSGDRAERLIRLYRVAGSPVKEALDWKAHAGCVRPSRRIY